MEDIRVFSNPEFGDLRATLLNNEPYFVGKEVAEKLGYLNASKAVLNHVDEEDRTIIQSSQNGNLEIPNRGLIAINESGLYSLILSSKLPKAKQFKRWVTSEVLPSIRKNGGYIAGQETLSDDELLEKAILVAQKKIAERDAIIQRQSEEIGLKNQRISELQPKASYYDVVLNCKEVIPISQISKDYGMSATKLNKILAEEKVQYKQGNIWLLYQKYAEQGYTSTKTSLFPKRDGTQGSSIHTYWTQKGRLFIYGLLKSKGILPTIERGN